MNIYFLRIFVLFGLFFSTSAFADVSFDEWLAKQKVFATEKLLANISPRGTARGVVVASPSKKEPDYFFHWVRDAALVMEVVRSHDLTTPETQRRLLEEFVRFSRKNQLSDAPSGLGEPKFHVDGRPYVGPWGRPQNDGPALRALVMSRWAKTLLASGERSYVEDFLYRAEIPAHTLIKADLEYVAHHWRQTSFDLWEEVRGHNFYTLVVQHQSLQEGADLARVMGDEEAAFWYEKQSNLIAKKLTFFWNADKQRIVATIDRDGGANYKNSGLDTSVLLAFLHTRSSHGSQSVMSLNDPKLVSTLRQIRQSFEAIYSVNKNHKDMAPAIGRYPEDIYYRGNPWVLTTAAYAEYYYLLASESWSLDEIKANIAKGDAYLKRIRFHTPEDGAWAEQIDRNSGYMLSARDLTWSYASFLTALKAREAIVKRIAGEK